MLVSGHGHWALDSKQVRVVACMYVALFSTIERLFYQGASTKELSVAVREDIGQGTRGTKANRNPSSVGHGLDDDLVNIQVWL